MARRLPPLNALRAFEAAGRLRSFTAAAEELGVTQVAVSRQVKALEQYFDILLFERSHRSIAPTQEAELLLPTISRALDDIGAATASVSRRGRRDILSIHSYTTFYQRWLIPRLADFRRQYPHIELRLTASLIPAQAERQNVDAMIRSGDGNWPGMEVEHLVNLDLIPVCSPTLYRQATRGGELPFDLRQQTLLHSIARPRDWASWTQAYGLADLDPNRGLKFEHSGLAYEAALQGMGVAMGIRVLILPSLSDRSLITPIPFAHRATGGYYLVHPSDNDPSPALHTFKRWLISCARSEVDDGDLVDAN